LLNQPELLTPYIGGNSTVTVSNETIAPFYMQQLQDNLSDLKNYQVILPDGEHGSG